MHCQNSMNRKVSQKVSLKEQQNQFLFSSGSPSSPSTKIDNQKPRKRFPNFISRTGNESTRGQTWVFLATLFFSFNFQKIILSSEMARVYASVHIQTPSACWFTKSSWGPQDVRFWILLGRPFRICSYIYKTVYPFYNQLCLLLILAKSYTAEILQAPSFFLMSTAVFKTTEYPLNHENLCFPLSGVRTDLSSRNTKERNRGKEENIS